MRLSKTTVCIIVIILFHLVGLVGFFVPALRTPFLKLVPFHLILMLIIVMISYEGENNKFWLFASLVFVLGIVAEWVGVHKQWIFGDYRYGETLGTKVFDIPLTIGVNWFVLIFSTGMLMQRTRLKSMVARILMGALVLVLLDLLIEPVAIRFDYWSWAELHPPLKNYLCWFGVSAVFLSVFELFKFKPQTVVTPVLLLVQFVFFGLLQIIS